ncbi:hypothetical protein BpHYR1_045928 [Brachionus plicatilis]|uniref:Uncharacterized protein n=1 Tax=Brachionus plicatilis TaxID=10195 RepID=A0A3M7P7P5_BRAPC|nr:hypothetical protein BpHYR1_045928 [Brachionus plicatilis]
MVLSSSVFDLAGQLRGPNFWPPVWPPKWPSVNILAGQLRGPNFWPPPNTNSYGERRKIRLAVIMTAWNGKVIFWSDFCQRHALRFLFLLFNHQAI